ncbi:tetratricopeptide repeat protein [Fulvivirga lutea]|uniref:Tetratricopeptide repeat protein n=1 Tax=Fulvivirga lutea TaxID=2810512 RepID=A0A974WFN6_9BACT|nr:tetratricopeptide repeat protein [Fulvivirga lutea]QSE96653.1 tetratricopeptide repeat protein [Fulvivirga lutea]
MKQLILIALILLCGCKRHSRHSMVSIETEASENDALAYLDEMIESGEANQLTYFKRAEVNLKLNNYSRALIDVQKSLELDPTYQESYLLQSQILFNKGDIQQSINSALQAEQRGLRNYELYKLLAINYLKLNEADNAEKAIQRLLDFNYSAENLSLKGDIYLSLKDTATAISSYTKAIDVSPELPRPYESLYQIYKYKNPTLAERYISSYLNKNDDNQSFLLLQADIYANRKSYDSAISIYKNLKEVVDTSSVLLNNMSLYYYQLNQYDTALMLAKNSLLSDSITNREAQLLVARSLDNLREYNESKLYYEALVKYDSTDAIALDELDKLNRKIAYLWRLQQQERTFDSIRTSAPPVVERKDVNQ